MSNFAKGEAGAFRTLCHIFCLNVYDQQRGDR